MVALLENKKEKLIKIIKETQDESLIGRLLFFAIGLSGTKQCKESNYKEQKKSREY